MKAPIKGFGMTAKEMRDYFQTDTLYLCRFESETLLLTEQTFTEISQAADRFTTELRSMMRYFYAHASVCDLTQKHAFFVLIETSHAPADSTQTAYLQHRNRAGMFTLSTTAITPTKEESDCTQEKPIQLTYGTHANPCDFEDDDMDITAGDATTDPTWKQRLLQWAPLTLCVILSLIGSCFWAVSHFVFDAPCGSELFYYITGLMLLAICAFWGQPVISKVTRHAGITVLAVLGITLACGLCGFPACGITVLSSYTVLLYLLTIPILLYMMKHTGSVGMLTCSALIVAAAYATYQTSGIFDGASVLCVGLVLVIFCERAAWFGKRSMIWLVLYSLGMAILSIYVFVPLIFERAYTRIELFLHPESDPIGDGFIYLLVRSLISESVWFGQGGVAQGLTSTIQYPYLSHYFLAYFSNAFGLWTFVAVVLLFVLFFVVCWCRTRQQSTVGRMFSIAVLLYLMLETVSFLANNLGYGIFIEGSLPFVSGHNLWINLMLTGVLLAVFNMEPAFNRIKSEPDVVGNCITKPLIACNRFLFSDGLTLEDLLFSEDLEAELDEELADAFDEDDAQEFDEEHET